MIKLRDHEIKAPLSQDSHVCTLPAGTVIYTLPTPYFRPDGTVGVWFLTDEPSTEPQV